MNDSTWQVADINTGSGGSNAGWDGIIPVGSTMYFSAEGASGVELYAHDTSNRSTWLVADINSGGGNSRPGVLGFWILVGDSIYFDADDGSSGRELWAHDTSSSGLTRQLADIRSGSQAVSYTHLRAHET